ncbi:MAG: ADOP family duplicated permease [Gemmatimonadota bacterium]|nr:ADOP family duplicated permease [Gemmatimonadota bacterium]
MFRLLQHFPTALRSFIRAPAFAWTVVLILGVGIALSSATGVVARGIAFAGLPVRDADRVVVLWGVDRARSFTHLPLAPLDLPGLASAMRGVATVAAGDYNGAYPWVLRARDASETPLRLRGTLAGGSYFDLLGARPVLGRALRPEDDVIGAPRVMVLAHSAWRTHFGGDPRVIGRSVFAVQHGALYTIVGVMPPGLDVPRGVEFWTAFAPTAARNGSLEETWWAVDVVARLAPGATPEQARHVLTAYYATLARAGKINYAGARATVRTLPELVSGDVRPAFTAVAGAAAVVLLVTCGNVAGLLLVRAGGRRRELAVRAAIGAGRGRLVRELLAEHALLAVAGGIVGAALAAGIVRTFAALAPVELPRLADLGVDWTLLGAVIAVTTLVVIVVGVAPAAAASRIAPAEALGGAREGLGGGSSDVRARRLLVGAQVAMALVVLAGASLVGRSLARLTALDLGLPAADQLAFVELVPLARGDGATQTADDEAAALSRWRAKQDAVMERVSATPEVVAVAPVAAPPYAGAGGWDGRLEAEGATAEDSARRPYLNMEITNADYLRVTGVPLLSGRWIAQSDRENAPPVIVLSERAARALFPGQEAVGRRVKRSADKLVTVVGVVGDTRFREFLEPRPTVYFPYRQFDAGATFLAVRTRGDPAAVATTIRRAVAEVDRAVLVQARGTMRAAMAAPLARPRLLAAVLGAYALVGVVLAVAGLYAVVAGSVAARRREFGVRAALGATPRALASLVLGEGLRVAAIGAVVGLVAALAGSRLLAAALYGIAPSDPATLAFVVAALLGVCAAAVLVPALRAASADPAQELRAE